MVHHKGSNVTLLLLPWARPWTLRSGVRLRSLGSGHTPLKLIASEQSGTRQRYKDLLATQTSSSHCLHRWSQAEESPALQDVLHQVHDLNLMWVEAQREFVGMCVHVFACMHVCMHVCRVVEVTLVICYSCVEGIQTCV